jgi:hypothetical protein
MDLFTIVPLIVGAGFVLVFGLILVAVIRGIAQWHYNNQQPVLSVPARVVAKRTEASGSSSPNRMGSTSTYYYCAFELPHPERREFWVSGQEYGLLAEGNAGTLTYQGTRYQGFRRKVP